MTPVLGLLGDLGGGEVLMIGILALLLFGSKRLPELGRAFGRAMREFKRATSGVEENLREVMRENPLAPTVRPASRQIPRGGAKAALPPTTSLEAPKASSPPTSESNSIAPPVVPPPPSASSPPVEKAGGDEDEIAS